MKFAKSYYCPIIWPEISEVNVLHGYFSELKGEITREKKSPLNSLIFPYTRTLRYRTEDELRKFDGEKQEWNIF